MAKEDEIILASLILVLQGDLLTDTRLTKNSDFDVSLQQITDFCSDVSKTSGVGLSVDKKVQDLKVDVFVDKKPLAETLDKVAKVLNCEWVPVAKGYRLEMSVVNINRERNFIQAEIDDKAKHLESRLWASEYVAKNTVANEIHHYSNSIDDEVTQRKLLEPLRKAYLDAHNANDTKRELEAANTLGLVQDNLKDFYFGRIFQQFDKDARAKFWQGEPFVASTFPNSRYKLFESDMRTTGVHSYGLRDGRSVEAEYQHCIFFRYVPLTGKMIANKMVFVIAPAEYAQPAPVCSQPNSRGRSTDQSIPESLKKLPFYEDLKSWSNTEATSAKFTQLIDLLTPTWDTPWFGYRKRLGDHLRWFHRATQIPVVAQADRSGVYEWFKLNRGVPTATEYLRQLVARAEVYTKEDSGFLLARNFRFWTHRQHEAPEAIWKSFEPYRKGEPTVDDLAKIASAHREDQIVSTEMYYPLAPIDLWRVEDAYDSLRFYGCLSNSQKAAAQTAEGIRMSDLDSRQQQLLVECIMKLILENGSCSIDLAKSIVANGNIQDRLSTMKFRVNVIGNVQTNDGRQEVKDGEEVLFKPSSDVIKATVSEMRFEFSDKDLLVQSIVLKK